MSKEIPFYIEKYIEFIFAQRNLSKNTILSYENDLKELVRFFGKKDPLIYSNKDIKDYIFFYRENIVQKLIVENFHQ